MLSQLLESQQKKQKIQEAKIPEFKKDKKLEKSKHGHGKSKVKDAAKMQAY